MIWMTMVGSFWVEAMPSMKMRQLFLSAKYSHAIQRFMNWQICVLGGTLGDQQ